MFFFRYSSSYTFLYCPITKAGSSTWIQHMIKLSGQTRDEFASKLDEDGVPVKIRRNMRREHFPVPEERTLEQVAAEGIAFRLG